MKPIDHPTLERVCINCQHTVDAALDTDGGDGPKPGDATLCGYCGQLMMFTADGFREPNAAEMYELAGDKDLITMSRALKAVWAMRRE